MQQPCRTFSHLFSYSASTSVTLNFRDIQLQGHSASGTFSFRDIQLQGHLASCRYHPESRRSLSRPQQCNTPSERCRNFFHKSGMPDGILTDSEECYSCQSGCFSLLEIIPPRHFLQIRMHFPVGNHPSKTFPADQDAFLRPKSSLQNIS